MKKKVELTVPKSLLVVLWVAAIGLVLNGVQPFLTTPANAVGDVQKSSNLQRVGRRLRHCRQAS